MRADLKKATFFCADRIGSSALIRSGIRTEIMHRRDSDTIDHLLTAILDKAGATIELRIATYARAKVPLHSDRDNRTLSPAMSRDFGDALIDRLFGNYKRKIAQ
jgi:hypothetical protein